MTGKRLVEETHGILGQIRGYIANEGQGIVNSCSTQCLSRVPRVAGVLYVSVLDPGGGWRFTLCSGRPEDISGFTAMTSPVIHGPVSEPLTYPRPPEVAATHGISSKTPWS